MESLKQSLENGFKKTSLQSPKPYEPEKKYIRQSPLYSPKSPKIQNAIISQSLMISDRKVRNSHFNFQVGSNMLMDETARTQSV